MVSAVVILAQQRLGRRGNRRKRKRRGGEAPEAVNWGEAGGKEKGPWSPPRKR
jgi:hypothetical protein